MSILGKLVQWVRATETAPDFVLDVSQGGLGANLSATGGAGKVLKQASAGASVTVGTLASTELSDSSSLERVANKDTANGYLGADSNGKLPAARLPSTAELTTNKGVASGYAGLDADALLAQAYRSADPISQMRGVIARPHGTTFDAINCGAATTESNSAAASLVDTGGYYVALDTTTSANSTAGLTTDVLASRETWPEFYFDFRSNIIGGVIWLAAATADPIAGTTLPSATPGVALMYDTTAGDNVYKLVVGSGDAVSISRSSDVFINASGVLVTKTGNWVSLGLKEGMLVTIGGTASNNVSCRVSSINSAGTQATMTSPLTQEGTTGSPIAGPVTVNGGGQATTTTTIPVSANARNRYRIRYIGNYVWEASVYNATTKAWDYASVSAGTFTPSASDSGTHAGDKLKGFIRLRQTGSTARTVSPRSILCRDAK